MDVESIRKTIISYIDQSIDGLEVENPKCDFKRMWYDLTDAKDISEFLKDTTSIANTFGLDGYIIIGFDPKTKTFHNSTLTDCKLKDSSYILDLINKKVDQLFDLNTFDVKIQSNSVSIIHIPPSIDKPHVIRNFQVFDKDGNHKNDLQKIFIRKNSSIYPASKYDLELMFYDKKNILPEYKVETYVHISSLEFNFEFQNNEEKDLFGFGIQMRLNIENLGRRPLAVNRIKFSLWLMENPSDFEIAHFETLLGYKSSPIIIQNGEFYSNTVRFNSVGMYKYGNHNIRSLMTDFKNSKKHLRTSLLTFYLANGNQITSRLLLNIQ